MELKTYQKKVIADLTRYLELLNETKSDAAAFRLFWQEKSAPTLGLYQNVIPGVPNLCFKVPTGGGKTFIACNAVRPIFDALPATKTKAVVWLVPSDAILTQTAKALKDTSWTSSLLAKVGTDGIEAVRKPAVEALKASRRFDPPTPMSHIADLAKPFLSLGNQYGEGWFLCGEMAELLTEGVPNIVCIQPFACLPNHVVGKGVIKALKAAYPQANIAAVDYDPGASEVNQLNRIKLMLSAAKKNMA